MFNQSLAVGWGSVRYPIWVGKDEDRPVLFQNMLVLVPTQGTYPTQHSSLPTLVLRVG